MAKFYGKIGFATTQEGTGDRIGIDEDVIIEKPYYGDVLRNSRRYENGESVLDNIRLDNKISIVADAYARNNIYRMKYISWNGALWNISNVEIERPRLILYIGGVYNGPTARLARNTGEIV